MLKKNCLLQMSEKGDELIISLSGEIDHHSAVRVRNEIDGHIMEMRPARAVIELSMIDFMDSSGLGLIMGRYAKMQSIGGELILRDPNERLVRIFKLAGLERIVEIEYTSKKENEDEDQRN